MMRRNFVKHGATLATLGIAGTALASTASPARAAVAPRATPTIFDFGAVGDGVTDDSAAFTKALQASAVNGGLVIVPGLTYAIKKTVNFVSTANAGKIWGLQCQGATLKSGITNGTDIVSITSNHNVRYFQIGGGLTIKGTGTDRDGLHFFATTQYIYNCMIDRVAIEGAGRHGLLMEGNVFESQITNSFFQDCKKNGATFAHSKGGVCSAINIVGCYFNQNTQYGLEATHFDAQYGGCADVRVYGGYCRQNGSYGFRYNNGTSHGAMIEQVGFENNCIKLTPGDPNGAHIYGMVRMQLQSCTGYNETGGATYMLRGFFSDLTTLNGCNQSAGAAMKATGKSRLVQVNGSDAGHVLVRGSNGGIDVVNGTKCTWKAENSTGPSPLGNLNVRGIVGV